MKNCEKYRNNFIERFSLEEDFDVKKIKRYDVTDWDSVGHMMLITALEDSFDMMFEMEDILAFDTYENGIEILKKYGIEM